MTSPAKRSFRSALRLPPVTYFGVVLLFALGAGVGSTATLHWGAGTIWLSCGLLTVSFLIMFIHDEEQKLNE